MTVDLGRHAGGAVENDHIALAVYQVTQVFHQHTTRHDIIGAHKGGPIILRFGLGAQLDNRDVLRMGLFHHYRLGGCITGDKDDRIHAAGDHVLQLRILRVGISAGIRNTQLDLVSQAGLVKIALHRGLQVGVVFTGQCIVGHSDLELSTAGILAVGCLLLSAACQHRRQQECHPLLCLFHLLFLLFF